MAFTYTVASGWISLGNKKMKYGTYTNTGASTGGDIKTGLSKVEIFWVQAKSDGAPLTDVGVNETFPITTAVTIVTTAQHDGYWFAIGI